MNKTKRNFFIILVIAAVVMFFSLRNDYENIIMMFSNINYFWILISLGVMVLYNLIDAYFIKFYFKRFEKDYSLRESIESQQTFSFFSAITPFQSGGQIFQIVVLKKQGISTERGASMAMISFISWQTILVLFGLIVLLFNYTSLASTYSAFFGLVFIGFVINLIVITGLFLSVFSKKFHDFIVYTLVPFLAKIKIFKDVEKKKNDVKIWLTLFRDEFNYMLVHYDIMIRRVLADLIKIVTLYSMPFFSALSLNFALNINDLLMVIILTSFVYMITAFVPLPGGSGGTEGMFVLLLNPVLGAATTSIMLMWRFLTYYLPMFVGFFIFAQIKELKE